MGIENGRESRVVPDHEYRIPTPRHRGGAKHLDIVAGLIGEISRTLPGWGVYVNDKQKAPPSSTPGLLLALR